MCRLSYRKIATYIIILSMSVSNYRWRLFFMVRLPSLKVIYAVNPIVFREHIHRVLIRDPPFVTPLIKLMLRQQNQLMRRVRVEAANALAIRIQIAIIARNSNNFCNDDNVKKLWEKVRQASGKRKSAPGTNSTITADRLNDHYSNVSTDPSYQAPTLKSTAPQPEAFSSEMQIFHLLDHLKPTSAGIDRFPSWFLKIAAPLLSRPLTTLFNLSVSWSVVPDQWKTSVITPVAEIPRPTTCADYRPISVSPILSRVLEKLVVRISL